MGERSLISVDLRDLKDGEKITLKQVVDAEQGDIRFEDLDFLSTINWDGSVERFKKTIMIQGRLQFDGSLTCSRCLEKITHHVDEPYETAVQFKNEEVIDIWPGMREMLILNHPIRFICKSDCKGLCPHCGKNLNLERCSCKEKYTDSPLHTLESAYQNNLKKRKK